METGDNTKQGIKVVVKVGTSTLTYPNGRLNFQHIERLVARISELQKHGKKIILVSSGAIAVGSGRIGQKNKPVDLPGKQALAALGQADLMRIYQKFFDQRRQQVAQVLLTKDIVTVEERRQNATNTLHMLMDMDIIPIINENDTVATDEIEFGDNDTLSAHVAVLVQADLLVLMSDIDGLYTGDPRTDPQARLIPHITHIDEDIEKLASGSSNGFGTGGMITKLSAAKICRRNNIPVMITNGSNPGALIDFFNGKNVGTLFQWTEK